MVLGVSFSAPPLDPNGGSSNKCDHCDDMWHRWRVAKTKKIEKNKQRFVLYENLIRFALLLLSSGAVLQRAWQHIRGVDKLVSTVFGFQNVSAAGETRRDLAWREPIRFIKVSKAFSCSKVPPNTSWKMLAAPPHLLNRHHGSCNDAHACNLAETNVHV